MSDETRPFDHGKERMEWSDEELAAEIKLLQDAEEALVKLGNRYAMVIFDIRMKLYPREGYMRARQERKLP